MNTENTRLLAGVSEAARLLSVSRSYFYSMLSSGRCPIRPIKFGKKQLWRVSDLEIWVKAGCPVQWGGEKDG